MEYQGLNPVAQRVKNPPAMQETWVWSLCQEDPLEEGMVTQFSILTWRIPWTEEPCELQSMESQRIRHTWGTKYKEPQGYPGALVVKNLPANAGDVKDSGSIPGPGRSPGERNGNPLQYSCLENPMGRGTWRAIVHSHTESNMTEQLTLSLWPVEFESKAWFPTGSTTNILGQYSLSQRLPCALQGTLQHPWPLPFRCQKHHFCPFSLDIGTLGMEVRNNTLLRIFGLINKIILKATIMQKDKCYSTDTMHVLTHSVMSEKKKRVFSNTTI